MIILGMMMCGGSSEMKARVLYDVLQDDMQETISASDKDFLRIFTKIILLSCYVLPRFYREETGKEYVTSYFPKVDTKEFEDECDNFKDQFLDDVYDQLSVLRREEFLTKVATEANWIFNIGMVRFKFTQ